MSTHGRRLWSVAVSITLVFLFLAVLLLSAPTWGQASYTAQIRGVVKDQSGAVVPKATITITNDATGISETSRSDDHGLYVLTGLRPAVYTIKADAASFRPAEENNVVLQVAQQATIDFTLHPLDLITMVEVTTAAPYVRTPAGWRYVFGQSSLPLPKPDQ